jgi:hypothetical protein
MGLSLNMHFAQAKKKTSLRPEKVVNNSWENLKLLCSGSGKLNAETFWQT